jgi:hypothetical protein
VARLLAQAGRSDPNGLILLVKSTGSCSLTQPASP